MKRARLNVGKITDTRAAVAMLAANAPDAHCGGESVIGIVFIAPEPPSISGFELPQTSLRRVHAAAPSVQRRQNFDASAAAADSARSRRTKAWTKDRRLKTRYTYSANPRSRADDISGSADHQMEMVNLEVWLK
jgi:hypothetical protein